MDAIKGLNNLIQEFVNNGAFPGGNYVLVVGDKSYYGSFGNKALYPNVEKNDIDTLNDMASVSKVISTTTCILKLIEEGKIRLFSKVTNYLPRFKHENITIFNLLTHTSGMQEGISNCTTAKSKEEVLDRLYSYDLKYTVATENCADRAALEMGLRDVITNQTANTQKILDTLCQDKIDAKNDIIAQLRQEVLYARGQA
jgi:CubicO group peptidase (beta-lactamase class C family)